jgi:hypothetical protein
MLIKLFGVPLVAQTKELAEIVGEKIRFEYANQVSTRVGFSPISIRRNNELGPIRILVTGLDAHGIEREVIGFVGSICEIYFFGHQIPWLGFEDPQLPGQPGPSKGRPQ